MLVKFIETLSWGVRASASAVISSAILDFDEKSLRNIVIGAFMLGCIRGYTGKNIVALLCEGY
jgi:hypothetical protein